MDSHSVRAKRQARYLLRWWRSWHIDLSVRLIPSSAHGGADQNAPDPCCKGELHTTDAFDAVHLLHNGANLPILPPNGDESEGGGWNGAWKWE
jgi:hypothetical protein